MVAMESLFLSYYELMEDIQALCMPPGLIMEVTMSIHTLPSHMGQLKFPSVHLCLCFVRSRPGVPLVMMITLTSCPSHSGHEESAFVLSLLFVDRMVFLDIGGSFSLEVMLTYS